MEPSDWSPCPSWADVEHVAPVVASKLPFAMGRGRSMARIELRRPRGRPYNRLSMPLDLRRKVAVVGVGCTQFGELYEKSAEDLVCDAVDEALADAGCERDRIEAAWVGTVLSPFG